MWNEVGCIVKEYIVVTDMYHNIRYYCSGSELCRRIGVPNMWLVDPGGGGAPKIHGTAPLAMALVLFCGVFIVIMKCIVIHCISQIIHDLLLYCVGRRFEFRIFIASFLTFILSDLLPPIEFKLKTLFLKYV
jgi:hypothetical protein